MKIFVLIAAVLVVSVQGDIDTVYEWSGSIRKLVDRANIHNNDLKAMTKRIFDGISQNCGNVFVVPTSKYSYQLPSPNKTCDLDIMHQMKEEMLKPETFNGDKFLGYFWSSASGQGLIRELEGRGVSENVTKESMRELWFNQTHYSDTSFNRLFLGTDELMGRVNYRKFQNWYTFDLQRRGRECNIAVDTYSIPTVVVGDCDEHSVMSRFIFPSHPFVDLVVYSLCAWTKELNVKTSQVRACVVHVPGSDLEIALYAVFYYDVDTLYLYDVYPLVFPVL